MDVHGRVGYVVFERVAREFQSPFFFFYHDKKITRIPTLKCTYSIITKYTGTLIGKHIPKLAKHWNVINIKPMNFVDWILTVFTSSFPFEFVLRVWDVFLLEGWSAFFRIAIALLQQFEKKLLSLNFTTTMLFLKNKEDVPGPQFHESIDIEKVWKGADRLSRKISKELIINMMGMKKDGRAKGLRTCC